MKIKLKADYAKFIPIGSGVILAIPREDVNDMVATEGGILVPASEDRKSNPRQECEVVAVGPLCKTVLKGDTVLYNLLNSEPIPSGDMEIRFAQEEHILCVTRRLQKPIEIVEP